MQTINDCRGNFNALLALTFSLTLVTACDSGNNETQIQTKLLTEKDFANNSRLRASPEQGTVALFLEPPSATLEGDSNGESGSDLIPYQYSRTLKHTFCFEDSNSNSNHSMVFNNSNGEQVLSITANDECVSAVIPAGEYQLVLPTVSM
ncbi:hypothetical protein L1D44_13680 [Shewanella sp. Isolate13]|uniref:hypothetical protein n=1 Tax=Shewanella sp. Isolate13 TaxID=2908531 RepID=UPI001EFCB3CD|nr:hypothetical protein [Shewanella sp. Isolate13]MCG9730879.1 hypothetical protein [Shewanella sp. Isolate13]